MARLNKLEINTGTTATVPIIEEVSTAITASNTAIPTDQAVIDYVGSVSAITNINYWESGGTESYGTKNSFAPNTIAGSYNTVMGVGNNVDGAVNIVGGYSNSADSLSAYAIINGENNILSSSTYGIINGENNTINAEKNLILGNNNIISGDYSIVLGSYNTMKGPSNLLFGNFSLIDDITYEGNIILGSRAEVQGDNNYYLATNFSLTTDLMIDGNRSGVLAGYNNVINGNDSGVIAGRDNSISGNKSIIIGGNDNIINAENSAIIACDNVSTSIDNLVIVPKFKATDDTEIVGTVTVYSNEIKLRGSAPNLYIDNTTEDAATLQFRDTSNPSSEKFELKYDSGTNTFTAGPDGYEDIVKITDDGNISLGYNNNVTGVTSIGIGRNLTVNNDYAIAFGYYAKSQGLYSFSEGYFTESNGEASFSQGVYTKAEGKGSFAGGVGNSTLKTKASGEGSFNFSNQYSTSIQYDVSGHYSAILGGQDNNVNGNNSATIGGLENNVDSNVSVAVGGSNNNISGSSSDYSAIIGGGDNIIENVDMSFIAGSMKCRTTADYAAIIGGFNLVNDLPHSLMVHKLIVSPDTSLPSSPPSGTIAFNGTHFYGYDGSSWLQLD